MRRGLLLLALVIAVAAVVAAGVWLVGESEPAGGDGPAVDAESSADAATDPAAVPANAAEAT